MNAPSKDRRKASREDRRDLPRGGRRAGDLPHPITCPSCGRIQEVKGLAHSRAVKWCRCRACGEVWPWSINL